MANQWAVNGGNTALKIHLRPPGQCPLVYADMFQWDKELRAIRTVISAGIGTSASVIYP
jgi:hypothetical protein